MIYLDLKMKLFCVILLLDICNKVLGWTCVSSVRRVFTRVNSDVELKFDISSALPGQNEAKTFNVAFYDGSPPIAVIRYAFGTINTSPADIISGDAAGNVIVKMKKIQINEAGTYKISSVTGTHGCNCLYILGLPTKPVITGNTTSSEGESIRLTCRSTSSTIPSNHSLSFSHSWRVNDEKNPTEYSYTSTRNTMTMLNVTRNDSSKQFTCTAKEVVNNGYESSSSDRVLLNIFYGTDGGPTISSYSDGDTYHVIDRTIGILSCTIKGGNPRPRLNWSCYNETGTTSYPNDYMVTETVTWTAMRRTDAKCTCQSSHIISGQQSIYVNVKILYPPTPPSFVISFQTVYGTIIKIIQGNSLVVECSSSSEPAPKFTWKIPRGLSEESRVLSISNVQISNNGQYSCEVENTMKPSSGGTVSGRSGRDIQVQVLYAPSVIPFNVDPVLEGSTLSVECKTRPGNPAKTTYSWKRTLSSSPDNPWQDIQGFSINGSQFYKTKINRKDAGTYKCTASNAMKPTAAAPQIGSSSQMFILNIFHKTSISSFFEVNHPTTQEVTVSENSSITLQCLVDSNPGSSISILKDGETKLSVENAKQISYIYSKVSCDTAGIYSCVGYNVHNTEDRKPLKRLRLFVTCSPRLPSPEYFVSNINSALSDEAELKITVVAYPVPKESAYVWSKWNGDTWETLTNDNNVEINTSGFDSSLRFQSVKVSDYQKYRVNVKNSFGQLQQEFILSPIGQPDPPENVNIIDGSLRKTSAIILWNPAFDGGTKQTFVVQYKKQGTSIWLEVSKEDERTYNMNVSLTDLDHGTTYVFRMYSKNIEGNSSFTDTLTFKTVATKKTESQTAIIGGAIGGSVTFIVVVSAGFVYILRQKKFLKRKHVERKDESRLSEQNSYMDLQSGNTAANEYECVHTINDQSLPEGDPKLYMELHSADGKMKEHIYNKLEKSSVQKDDSNTYVNLKI